MTHPFDADTTLAPLGERRWRASVSERWFVETGPNGGFLAALATRALMLTTGGDREPRSLTLHFLAPPQAGEVELETTVERAGRSTTFVSLRIRQRDQTVALGLGFSAVWREGQPEWDDTDRPTVAAPADSHPLADVDGAPRFLRNYEMRPFFGPLSGPGGSPEQTPAEPPRPARVGGWMRTAEPRPADPILLAALTDAWVPSAFLRMEEPTFVPTIDLTIHWRAPAGAAPGGHPWVLGAFTTRRAAGGTWEEDGELWSEDGVLLAQSRQLAIVRSPRG